MSAAQLLLGLRNCDLVTEATDDQTIKKVKVERPAIMANRPPSKPELGDVNDILWKKDNKLLRAACRRLSMSTSFRKSILIRQLRESYDRGFGVDDPIYTPSGPEATIDLEASGESQQSGSVSDPIRVEATLGDEFSSEATDQSQHGRARKRRRRNTSKTGEGITVIDFANPRGSEQIDLDQKRGETPLPHIQFRFDPNEEYVVAKAKRDQERKESLAEEMRQRRDSGPPTAEQRETKHGLGSINTDEMVSRTSRHPNVAPMGMLSTTIERTNLSKLASINPRARHQLAPPLPSEFNPSIFPTSEHNIALGRHYLHRQGYTGTRDPNTTAPGPRAVDDREARARVHADHTRTALPARRANVPQSDYTLPSITASRQEGGTNERTTTYIPAPQPYGVNNSIVGQPGPNNDTSTYTPTFQGYGDNYPIMGRSSANHPTIINTSSFHATITTPPFYAMNNPSMGEPGADDLRMIGTPPFDATNNPMMAEAAGGNLRVLSSPAPQYYERKSPVVAETVAYDPPMTDTPTPELFQIEHPIVAEYVRDSTTQPQQRFQAQSRIQRGNSLAMNQPGARVHTLGSGLYPTTRTDSSVPSRITPEGRERSMAGRHGGRAHITTTPVSNTATINPNIQQPSTIYPAFGVVNPGNQAVTRTYYRVRIRNLPYNARREELQNLFSSYPFAFIDQSQLIGTHVATIYFDDPFNAEGAVLALDGAQLRGFRLRAERVDRHGFVIAIGAEEF